MSRYFPFFLYFPKIAKVSSKRSMIFPVSNGLDEMMHFGNWLDRNCPSCVACNSGVSLRSVKTYINQQTVMESGVYGGV